MMLTSLSDTPPALHLQIHTPQRVFITLVGCGGTGSHIASGLASIALALAERDIRTDIYLVDPDVVEDKNVGRQLFSPGDVGQPKAAVIAHRLTTAFGLRVGGSVRAIDSLDTFIGDDMLGNSVWNGRREETLNIVVGAVDNPAARSVIAKAVENASGRLWWLDAGNENHTGQACIGNTADPKAMRYSVALGMIDRLPAPHLVYPDLIKTPVIKAKTKRSCAELTAEGTQGLMVNRMMAAWTCSMLDAFLVRQDLRFFAVAVDLQWGGVKPYTIDLPTLSTAIGTTEKQLTER